MCVKYICIQVSVYINIRKKAKSTYIKPTGITHE